MKINFSDYDLTDFIVKDGGFCGIPAKLITPNNISVKFNQKNKIFRSSIWDLEGNLLSGSFKKFMNMGQDNDIFPVPLSLDNTKILEKIDGSTMICDCVNGNFSIRTRGTFSYKNLDNCQDFEFVLKKYPKIEQFVIDHDYVSFLFEIVSPNQKIIIDYGSEPDIYLIGAIDKQNYDLFSQGMLNLFSFFIDVKRPKLYNFDKIDSLVKFITESKGIEGCCLYSNNDQDIHKIKSQHYLILHRLKSELSSLDKVIDIYLSLNKPNYEKFYDYIAKTFDFELAKTCSDLLKKSCDLGEKAKLILDEIKIFVSPMAESLTKNNRKEFAFKIINEYKDKGLESFAFNYLNKHEILDKDFKKLMYIIQENE